MKYIFLIVSLLSTYPIFCQSTIDENNHVSNFNFETNFNFVGSYDYDLGRRTGRDLRHNVKLLIRIGNQGEGRLVLYFQKKTVFNVHYCVKDKNNYHFYLNNNKKIILWVNNSNTVTSLTLENDDNTATIFF